MWMHGGFVDCIYPIELEMKDTADTARSASYLDIHLEIDSDSLLKTKLYDKRDDFNFFIANLISILNLATFQQHLHMEYTSLSWSDIVVPIMISLMLDADKETFESRVPSG